MICRCSRCSCRSWPGLRTTSWAARASRAKRSSAAPLRCAPSGWPAGKSSTRRASLGGAGDDVLLEQIGFYEVVGGGSSELVAVNFDPRESDLTPTDAATVERWKGLGALVANQTSTGVATVEDASVPSPLGPWLLIVLLLIAVVESWVGNWHLRVRRGIAA